MKTQEQEQDVRCKFRSQMHGDACLMNPPYEAEGYAVCLFKNPRDCPWSVLVAKP